MESYRTAAIDIENEQLLGLRDAAAHVTTKYRNRRGGRAMHISTICRWISRGIKGVKLESIAIGGTRATSVEALNRFFARLSGQEPGESAHGSRGRRANATETALDKLDKLGI